MNLQFYDMDTMQKEELLTPPATSEVAGWAGLTIQEHDSRYSRFLCKPNGAFKEEERANIACKDVVIIGNGPSGITLSYMLDGHLPYYNGKPHPDEMLTARMGCVSQLESLVEQDLRHLSVGLEGRSTNPISLLIDALEHPCADLGIELKSLIEWRKNCSNLKKFNHVVLGKGPPGGAWHNMDPNVLTLSLGSWMALPSVPYNSGKDTRTSAGQVAEYYAKYVEAAQLGKYFQPGTVVTKIRQLKKCKRKRSVHEEYGKMQYKRKDCFCFEISELCSFCEDACCYCDEMVQKKVCYKCIDTKRISLKEICQKKDSWEVCDIIDRSKKFTCDTKNYYSCSKFCNSSLLDTPENSPAFNRIVTKCDSHKKLFKDCDIVNRKEECQKSFDKSEENRLFSTKNVDMKSGKENYDYELHKSEDTKYLKNHDSRIKRLDKYNPFYIEFGSKKLESYNEPNIETHQKETDMEIDCECSLKWQVDGYDTNTGRKFTYFTKHVVLATGSSDSPNRLGIKGEDTNKDWIFHNLREFEDALDVMTEEERKVADPVLIIGAGLSAADAIISTRLQSLPVLHVFRRKNVALDKQLPENMYPEYHKVHQMMSDGEQIQLYKSLPEHSLVELHPKTREVTLQNTQTGICMKQRVSHIAILIGSRPDLNFLPSNLHLGIDKSSAVDCKTNPIAIDQYTHEVQNIEGMFALGPLAGDNFVRFIPGGAVAIVSSLLRDNKN